MGDVSAARTLARFVVGLSLDDVPAPVATAASLLALDTLGNALAAVPEDFGRAAVRASERLGGPPESTLIGSSARVSAANAALANGTLANGLDFDDTREDAIVRPGGVRRAAGLSLRS